MGRARTHGHRCWVGLTRLGNRRGPAEAVRGSAAGVLAGLTCLTSRRSTAVSNSRRARVKNLTPKIRPHWYEVAVSGGAGMPGQRLVPARRRREAAPAAAWSRSACHVARGRPAEGEQAPPTAHVESFNPCKSEPIDTPARPRSASTWCPTCRPFKGDRWMQSAAAQWMTAWLQNVAAVLCETSAARAKDDGEARWRVAYRGAAALPRVRVRCSPLRFSVWPGTSRP